MKKKKDFSFHFYPENWMLGTYELSQAEKGCFIDLLCLQHQKGHLDLSLIEKVCQGIPGGIDKILTKFVKTPAGKYYNAKLQEVMLERNAYKTRQSDLAKRRWSKTDMPTHMPDECPPDRNKHINRNTNKDNLSNLSIGDLEGPSFNSLEDLFFNTQSED